MILLVEDGSYLYDFAGNLSQRGYDVEWVRTMSAACYKIKEKPGAYAYDAVILDLDIPTRGLPPEALETAEKIYSGWAFYCHVLNVLPELQARTIFLTGFYVDFKEKIGEEHKKLYVLCKDDRDQLKKVCDLLRQFKKF